MAVLVLTVVHYEKTGATMVMPRLDEGPTDEELELKGLTRLDEYQESLNELTSIKMKKLLKLIENSKDLEMTKAFWGIVTTAYALGKGELA